VGALTGGAYTSHLLIAAFKWWRWWRLVWWVESF
jgi:hypothetical protein